MTFYATEILRIKDTCYANQGQINVVMQARNFINHNFEKELHLDLLSQICLTSKFHLLRLFKKYYGQTPQQYITDKRIEIAKDHLSNGMMISEACFLVGFDCPSSFSTLFKRKTGVGPLEFQKRAIFTK